MASKPSRGRPTAYKPAYAKQAEKLCALGATDKEIADFFGRSPSEDEWLAECLRIIREDRHGHQADRRRQRAARIAASITPALRLRKAIASRLWAAMKGKTDGALFSRLGYSLRQLQRHLEAQFADGMSWENYGEWHVDHRKPCALFDHSDPAQVAACWSLSNLQPLWAADNIKKGARYAGP
jgi:hypothetical protein